MSSEVNDSVAISVGDRVGEVSAILQRPRDAWILYVLAHGAGAGMRHHFMDDIAGRMSARGVATLRYQFPYIEAGRKRPDVPGVLHATVRAAVAEADRLAPDLPRVAGGKSMGGRMTSGAQARDELSGVAGIAFLGFPLHAPGRHDATRADHLDDVSVPLLFVQGTRDNLADLELLRPVCRRLGSAATLHIVEDGDHSFKVRKRSGISQDEVMEGIADAVVGWARKVVD